MVKVSFYGGAQEVTGSCFLFESESKGQRSKILIDCGLFQCPKFCDLRSAEPFPFNPKEVDAMFVTHAHIDHSGRIPKLVREGFSGKIFSVPPTRELAELMLVDSMGVLEKESKRDNREMLYSENDVAGAMDLWQTIEYHVPVEIGNFKVRLRNSGHILGSSMIDMEVEGKKIVVTGDLGNPPTPLLKSPEEITDAEVLLVESTYGSRIHEDKTDRKLLLERTIEDTLNAGGVLMVPAFSLERTQELLFEINDLIERGRVPAVPVFLDSPLAIKATGVYKKYESYFNKDALRRIKSGDNFFQFKGLKLTLSTEESKSINNVPAPKVIIAGSGMSNGGRIIHHERKYLPDPKSTLLIVGYQAAGSMGRIIQDGAKEVTILGERIPVRAKISTLHGYSSHPDSEQLLNFIEKDYDAMEKLFAIQGEPESCLFLVQRVRDHMGKQAFAPKYGESYEL